MSSAGSVKEVSKGTVFLKQFGERRTGTNYFRNLLLENFTNVVVLMHVLGDKHSVPVPLSPPDDVSPESACQWVRGLTLARPAEFTAAGDAAQEEYLRSIAVPLAGAVRRGELGFVLNVKDPYAWGASFCGYRHLVPSGLPRGRRAFPIAQWLPRKAIRKLEEIRACKHLQEACQVSNHKHRAWLEQHERFASRSSVVRYEDVLSNPSAILSGMRSKHGLREGPRRVESISREVSPAEWDHQNMTVLDREFELDHYRERRYLQALTPAMTDTITRFVDWNLMAAFGYRPI